MFCNPQSQNSNQPMAPAYSGLSSPQAQNSGNSFNMLPNQRPMQNGMQVSSMGNGSIPMAPTQNMNPYGMNIPPMGTNMPVGNMGSPYGNMQPVRVEQPQQQQQTQWPQPQMYGMNNQPMQGQQCYNNPMNTCMQGNFQQQQQQPQSTYRPH